MICNKYGILSLLMVSLVSTASIARAEVYTEQREQTGYLGVLVGVNNATNSSQNTTPALGATLGADWHLILDWAFLEVITGKRTRDLSWAYRQELQ